MDKRRFEQNKNIFGVEIIEIFVILRDTGVARKLAMKVNKFDQLGVLKQRIKSKMQMEVVDLNLLTKGRLLKGDHKILKEFRIEPKQVN